MECLHASDRDELDRPQRCTALIASELRRYNVAVLSKTRLTGEGKLCEQGTGYILLEWMWT